MCRLACSSPASASGSTRRNRCRSAWKWTREARTANRFASYGARAGGGNQHGEAEIGARGGVPLLRRAADGGYESRAGDLTQGAGARGQARSRRGAVDPGGGEGAARGGVPAVDRGGEDARRRAIEALRGGAAAGARGTGGDAAPSPPPGSTAPRRD